MVHVWGAYAGEPDELAPPDGLNARGRWEYLPLWELLAAVGEFASRGSWWRESFQREVTARAEDDRFATPARSLVRRMEAAGRPWMWKDPALCHFLGFWKPFWDEPIFVTTVRHPVDVAVSWNQFRKAGGAGETSLRCNLLRWQQMTLLVLRALDADAAKLFVEYEAVIDAPSDQARRLAAFLDEHSGTRTAESTVAGMAAVSEPALRRNREGRRLEGLMSEPQRSLYELLRASVEMPSTPFTELYPMPPDWRAYVMAQEDASAAGGKPG